jgi:hypothetical protein
MPGGFQSLDATVRQHLRMWFERCGAQATSWRVQSHLRRRKHDEVVGNTTSSTYFYYAPVVGVTALGDTATSSHAFESSHARDASGTASVSVELSDSTNAASASVELSDDATAASASVELSDTIAALMIPGAPAEASNTAAGAVAYGAMAPAETINSREPSRVHIDVEVASRAEPALMATPLSSAASGARGRNLSPLPSLVILGQVSEI